MRQFSDAHLAALAALVAAVALAVWAPRRHPGSWTVPAARTLALLIFAGWAGEYVADVVLGTWTIRYDLPLQLTDAISVTAIVALWTRRPLAVELAYFRSVTASLQATQTPDLSWSFPSVYYFTYFIYHVGAIVGGCFLVLGCRLYPRRGAVWRVYAATFAVTVIAALGDAITGGNYMFLREKPEYSSLLNVLGPWPWYIASTAALALALLWLVQLFTDWVRRHDRGAAATGAPATVLRSADTVRGS
ncbi:MAG TPA: TIGR02206 family membrane protein [Solirubrobacteraceae bacterium]|nr:TIGR02206 family membrane protein [Solirubrobacteraceae bacterium]